jgi:hypothetical protein
MSNRTTRRSRKSSPSTIAFRLSNDREFRRAVRTLERFIDRRIERDVARLLRGASRRTS